MGTYPGTNSTLSLVFPNGRPRKLIILGSYYASGSNKFSQPVIAFVDFDSQGNSGTSYVGTLNSGSYSGGSFPWTFTESTNTFAVNGAWIAQHESTYTYLLIY